MRSVIPVLVALVVLTSGAVGVVAADDPLTSPTPAPTSGSSTDTASANNSTSSADLGGASGHSPVKSLNSQTAEGANDLHTTQTVVEGSVELWRHKFHSGETNDFFIDSVTLDDGSVVSVGYVTTENSNFDAIAVKIGPDGEVDWERQFGGDGYEALWGVTATGDGGALLVGDTNSPSYTGGGQSYEGLVVKMSSDGTAKWSQVLGSDEDDFLGDAVPTDDGYLLVGDRNYLDSQNVNPWTVKIDESGNVVNSEVTYTNAPTSYWGVDRGETGDILATGTVLQDGNSYAGHVSELTASGDVEWNSQVSLGENRALRFRSAVTAPDGDIVVAGDLYDTENTTSEAAVSRFDPNGDEQWTRVTTTDGFTVGFDIERTGNEIVMPAISPAEDGGLQTEVIQVYENGTGTIEFTVTGLAGYDIGATTDGNLILAGQSFDDGALAASVGAYEYDGGTDEGDGNEDANHLLRYEADDLTLSPGESTTVDIVLTNATDGIGAFNYINATVSSTSAVEITDISTTVAASAETTVATDGSEAAVRVPFGGDTSNTGNVVLATVTIEAQEQGEAQLRLGQTGSISDETGQLYSGVEVENSTVTVSGGPSALPGFENAPTDPDGDGAYEDLNGNGGLDIGDVQALFANQNSDVVQNNVAAFDFNDNGGIDIGDVQALFNEIVNSS